MATYEIAWKASALRELRRLDRQVVPRVVKAVESLSRNPFPAGVRKLQGAEGTYRIRVGDHRIVYEVYQRVLLIEVIRVRRRKDVSR